MADQSHHTTVTDVDDLRSRIIGGETLHHGVPPGVKRKRSWWLMPSRAPVTDDAVQALRASTPMRMEIVL